MVEGVRFYGHSLFGTPSGGHIFLCLKKDMEERQTKGAAAPLDPRGNVLEDARRTVCLRIRNGACDAIKSSAVPRSKYPWGALRLSPAPRR